MAKKYRLDTPKGQTQQAYDEKGQDEATRVAKTHDIAESRLARWFREWSGQAPVRSSKGASGGSGKSETAPFLSKSGYTPIWYDTQKRAEGVMADKIKTMKMDPSVYVIVKNEGKFGFAPAHLAQEFGNDDVKTTEFKNNERIEYKLMLGQFGKVVTAGAEVSDVLWDDGRSEAVSNYYLKRAPAGNKASKPAKKAEEPKESKTKVAGKKPKAEEPKARDPFTEGQPKTTKSKSKGSSKKK